MGAINIFWILSLLMLCSALAFVIPPLWLTTPNNNLRLHLKFCSSVIISMSFAFCAYYAYFKLGASSQLPLYYNFAGQQQDSNKQMQPLYAKLQRDLIKSRLNLPVAAENVDLIINFANIHAQLGDGVLPEEVQSLLHGLLRTLPEQVTALNLLAIHAYKTTEYSQAIAYWQKILQQISSDMQNNPAKQILLSKISETKLKQYQFESKLTK